MLYVNPLENLRTTGPGATGEDGPRRQVALQELEHLFMFTLLQEMRKTVPKDKLFGKDAQAGAFDEMMDDALSGEMAKSGQIGMAKQVEEQLRINDIQRSLRDQASRRDEENARLWAGQPAA